jgi:hypothetical protein
MIVIKYLPNASGVPVGAASWPVGPSGCNACLHLDRGALVMSDRGLPGPCCERERRFRGKAGRPPLPVTTPACNAFVPRGAGEVGAGGISDDITIQRVKVQALEAQSYRARVARDEAIEVLHSLEREAIAQNCSLDACAKRQPRTVLTIADVERGPIRGPIVGLASGPYGEATLVIDNTVNTMEVPLDIKNGRSIEAAYGAAVDGWIGMQVELTADGAERFVVTPIPPPGWLSDDATALSPS